MRMRRSVLAILVLACLLMETGTAAGYLARGRQLTRIELEGSNGYSILIVADRKQHLILTTTRDAFTTEYMTHDTLAGPNRLKATLPGLGSISVGFHPSGPAHRAGAFAGCVGPGPIVRKGVVRGSIEFAGERKYTQVDTHKAPGEIEEWKAQRCRAGSNPEINLGLSEWISKFSAWTLGIEFLARKYRPGVLDGGNRILYSVETGEAASERASFAIHRRAVVEALGPAFDARPEHMAISPPLPFTGVGTLARTPESVFTWEGDLAIQFPGMDPLPLTGPSFEPGYCQLKVGCFRQHVEPADEVR